MAKGTQINEEQLDAIISMAAQAIAAEPKTEPGDTDGFAFIDGGTTAVLRLALIGTFP